MLVKCVLLIVGMAMLIKGADFFVGGASRIAKALKIPPLVIGLTLVSMGTSAPEASVSINGAVNGLGDIALGNVIGSNIFNILLILGVSAAIAPLAVCDELKQRDLPIMVAVFGAALLFAFGITPYEIDAFEGCALLIAFAGYIAALCMRARRSRSIAALIPSSDVARAEKPERKKEMPLWLSVIASIGGLIAVIFGGEIVVDNAAGLARAAGMSEALVGLTIVAVGTSLPELVTSIVASVKKENDIAVGNIVGSNIFNIVFILGLTAAVKPIAVDASTLVDLYVMLGAGILIAVTAKFSQKINRSQGIFALLLYIGYLTYIIIRN